MSSQVEYYFFFKGNEAIARLIIEDSLRKKYFESAQKGLDRLGGDWKNHIFSVEIKPDEDGNLGLLLKWSSARIKPERY